MTTYMLHWYQPVLPDEAFLRLNERLARAVVDLQAEGVPVRHLASGLSRRDEIAFCLVEAPSSQGASEVGARAGLVIDHLTDVLFVRPSRASLRGRRGPAERPEPVQARARDLAIRRTQ